MAKTAKKLESFFGARRRRCTLVRGELLRSKGKERRMKLSVKLSVTMPLTSNENGNNNLTDCPEPFLLQFAVMEKQDSASNRATIDVEFDSMAVRMFATDNIVNPTVSIQGALLHKFAMIGEGTGEKRSVSLDFLIYLPATEELRAWEWLTIHSEFWLESVKSQGSLDLSDEAEDEDEDEEISTGPVLTQPPPDKRIQVVPPPAGKSGPKQLAEYHAQQVDDSPKRHFEPPATTRRKPGSRVN
jgi:hypothetical protein